MAEFHRKIELQSPDDLQYLVSNIRRAADAEIERSLPRMEEEKEDDMRPRVEELVEEYITTVIRTTAANITINGMKADGDVLKAILNNRTDSTRSIEEHEPFNTKLFAKAKDLATKEEELIEEIAKLRRETPGNVVEGYKGRYKEVAEGDEIVLGGLGEGQSGEGVRLAPLERQDKIEKSWEGGVGGLERMVKTLPETVAKKERAERVEGYVVSGDRR